MRPGLGGVEGELFRGLRKFQAPARPAPATPRAAKTELLDPVAHLIAVDAEQLRRLRLVASGAFECLHERWRSTFSMFTPSGGSLNCVGETVRVSVVKS
jgi:hypothetical protein